MAAAGFDAYETALKGARALAAPLKVGSELVGLFEPWLLLLSRVWLAQAFLTLPIALMRGTGQNLSATLGRAWWFDTFQRVASSGWGSTALALLPVLFLLGLAVRPVSVLMLIPVAMLRPGRETVHVFLAMLFACLLVRGAGRLSLDGLFGRGVASSALPGARLVTTIQDKLDRHGPSILFLVLRLLVAAVLVNRSGDTPIMPVEPGLRDAMAMLPSTPGLTASLPDVALFLGAALLAGGLATRVVAFGLLVLAPIGSATIASDATYWVLLLGFLVIDGGGGIAIDAWLGGKLHAMIPPPRQGAHRVVVVGAGFAGCAVSRGLGGCDCHVTLIDQHNYHLFQPLLYQVATAGLSASDIATPIRGMFRGYENIRVLLGTVTGVDRAAQEVVIGPARIAYDTLVLATGAQHAYFGHDEWSDLAPGLKSVDDATAVRRRILRAFEEAESTPDATERRAWQTFVVIGGGPTGVEIAGAIAELARFGMSGDFRSVDPTVSRIVLVQSAPRLLPTFAEKLSIEAAAALRRLGVDVLLEERAVKIDPSGVFTTHGFIPTRSVLWAAGVKASAAALWLGAEADRAGRILVGIDLLVPGCQNIFAIGDTCASMAWAGEAVPGLAPAAKQAGEYVARAIRSKLQGRPPPAPFVYRHQGSLATIGRKAAVADFGRIKLTGAPAWWLWGAVHLFFLIDGRSRAGVLVEWFWGYLTLRRGTRLITGDRGTP